MRRKPSAATSEKNAEPRPTHERLPFLEGLRGVAALYVVLGHIASMADPSALAGRTSHAPEWVQAVSAPFAYGHLAVAAFITISGFCLQLSLFSSGEGRIPNLARFYVRRARRILPPYYACLAISILVCLTVTSQLPGMPFDQYLPVTPNNVAAHVLMVHNLSTDWMYKLNGVLWSIAIEAQLYVVFPLLVLALLRFGRTKTLIGALVGSLAVLAIWPAAVKLYPWYLALFIAGMAAAHLTFRPPLRRGSLKVLVGFTGVAAFVATLVAIRANAGIVVLDLAFGLSIACLAYLGTIGGRGRLIRLLSLRPIVAVGAFSYSLYLMHHPVEQVVYFFRPTAIVGEGPTLIYLAVVGLPVMVGASWLFSIVFERPFLRKPLHAPEVPRSLTLTSLPILVANPGERRPIIRRSVEGKATRTVESLANPA